MLYFKKLSFDYKILLMNNLENSFFNSKGPKLQNTSNQIQKLNKDLEERGIEENDSHLLLKHDIFDSKEPQKPLFSEDLSSNASNKKSYFLVFLKKIVNFSQISWFFYRISPIFSQEKVPEVQFRPNF